jgi:hypothetical protein
MAAQRNDIAHSDAWQNMEVNRTAMSAVHGKGILAAVAAFFCATPAPAQTVTVNYGDSSVERKWPAAKSLRSRFPSAPPSA